MPRNQKQQMNVTMAKFTASRRSSVFSAGSRRSMAVRARHMRPSVPLTARQTRPAPRSKARTARAARLRFFR